MIVNEQIIKNSLNRFLNTTPIYSDFKKGLNKLNNQAEIDINELYTADNMVLSVDMGLYSRGGVGKLISVEVPQQSTLTIKGLFHARFSKGDKIIVCIGRYIYAWHNNSWLLLSGSLTRTDPVDYSFAFMNDTLIIADGVNKAVKITYDGSNFNVNEITNAPITKFVVAFYNFLFFAGDNTNKVYFSSAGNIDDYPVENSFSIGGSKDNSQITGITTLLGNLIVFKKNSTYYVSGSTSDTFTITQISNSIGCIFDGCYDEAENSIYFLGQNGLWRLTSGMSLEYLFTKLQPLFYNFNFSYYRPKIIFNPDKRQIWLIVGYSTTIKVFVFDLVVSAFSTYSFYKDDNVNMFPIVNAKYYNQNSGIINVIGCNEKDRYVRIYDVYDYITDDGYEVYAELETKLFNLGDPLRFKSLRSYTAFGSTGAESSNEVANGVINKFDTTNNTNTKFSYYLNDFVRGNTAHYYNNKIYVFGGYNGNVINKVQIIDLSQNSVSYGADMPIALAYHSSVLYNNKIYLFGGWKGGSDYNKKVYIYDITNNSWSYLDDSKDMPTPRSWCTANLYGSKVYVIGGYNSTGYLNVNEEFDLNTLTWTTKQSMSYTRALHSSVLYNNKIYLFGGFPISPFNNAINVSYYDITNNTYTNIGNIMPESLYEHGSVNISNYGYIVGGYNYQTSNGSKNVYKFDFSNNTFSKVGELFYKNYWFGITNDTTNIYVIGGISLYDAKIGFKFTNDFTSFTTQQQGLICNEKQIITSVVSNALYKFVSVILKIKLGYTSINVRGITLDYMMWVRRQ